MPGKVYIYLDGEKGYEDVFHSEDPHKHTWAWIMCTHNKLDSVGNQPMCRGNFKFVGTHQICAICGVDRFPDGWGKAVEDKFRKRAAKIGMPWQD